MNAQVTPIRGAMTEAEYDKERAQLRSTYGDSSVEAGVRREQALARLFARSNWTMEQLAEKEGKSRRHIARQITFGRFLEFGPMGPSAGSMPNGLTERRFREYWERVDKKGGNEHQRFAAVLALLQDEVVNEELVLVRPSVKLPKVGNALAEKFADGKWHARDAVLAAIDAPAEQIDAVLKTMACYGSYNCDLEKKKVGTSYAYRIFRKTRTVSADEIATKLTPIIEVLNLEAKKHAAQQSPLTIARCVAQLRRLLEEWGREGGDGRKPSPRRKQVKE